MPSCDQDGLKALEAARSPSDARAMQAIKPTGSHVLADTRRRAGRQLSSAPSLVYPSTSCPRSPALAFVRTPYCPPSTVCQEPGARSQEPGSVFPTTQQPTSNRLSPRQAPVASPRTADETLQQNPQHSTDKTWEFDMDQGGLAESQNSRNCHPANPELPFTVSTSVLGLRDPASNFMSVDLRNAVACNIIHAMLSTARVWWCHETNNGPRQTYSERMPGELR